MAEQLRIGLIGYGFASKTFHAPLINGTPGMSLDVISSRDAAKVRADWPSVQVVDNPQALINHPDIDLIVIPTPNDTHFPLAKQALLAGKHVVIDKPFTVTLSQAHELKQLAESAGRLLSVFHNRRWDSDFLTLKGLMEDGNLGDISYFESHFDRFRPEVQQRWREQAGAGSGIWYDLGPHLIDQAITLFGMPVAINADLAQLRPGGQTTDYFHATLTYPNKRVALHGTLLAAAESPRYIVHGGKGSYVKWGLDPQEDRLKSGLRPPAADWGQDDRHGVLTHLSEGTLIASSVPTLPGNYPAYYAAITQAVQLGSQNPVTAEQAIKVMELIELGIASSEQKKTLAVKNG
ncbi:oxidoreductase [Biostraticola tofi]|uniref:Putative dehydrogenase n=1 Tax=Biostraticola tofi TaxID=466109 RepID=A0A4R3Z3D4_9GAMM|nr:oxidoreductase [Biostraticola tofi]TCV99777.1 putative dehydrogenase [Biostraticola tofi]